MVLNPTTGPRFSIAPVAPFSYERVYVGKQSGQFSVTPLPDEVVTITETTSINGFRVLFTTGSFKMVTEDFKAILNLTVIMSAKWRWGRADFHFLDALKNYLAPKRFVIRDYIKGTDQIHQCYVEYSGKASEVGSDISVELLYYSLGGENRLYLSGEYEILELESGKNIPSQIGDSTYDLGAWETPETGWVDLTDYVEEDLV